jgi:hypothetical protein
MAAAAKTKKATEQTVKPGFKIQRDRIYEVRERPDDMADDALKAIGRNKMTPNAKKPATCLYLSGNDDELDSGMYDTGFTESSIDFRGLNPDDPGDARKIKKALEERKRLSDYYNTRLQAFLASRPNATEKQFLATSDEVTLMLSHQLIINTDNIADELRLYMAFRGKSLVPSTDLYNPEYNGADYILYDNEQELAKNSELSERRHELRVMFYDALANNQNLLMARLRKAGVIGRESMPKSMLSSLFEERVTGDKAYENVEAMLRAFDAKPDEVLLYDLVLKHATKPSNKRQGTFYFQNIPVGRTTEQAVEFFKKKENEELYDKLVQLNDDSE